jgi:hypothetical protein
MERKQKITDTIDTIQDTYEGIKMSIELLTVEKGPLTFRTVMQWRASFEGKSATLEINCLVTDGELYDKLIVIVLEVMSKDQPNLILV